MKTQISVIAALFATVSAEVPDLPPVTPESQKIPFYKATTFNSGMLSAAGLVELDSACAKFGSSGVTCGPSDQELFATGMNGDEDLGEDITMKGDKFHFVQNLVQAPKSGSSGGTAIVYDTTGYGPVEKLSFFDPKITKAHTSFYSQFASGMNGDEDLGEDITMKGDKFHFAQNLAQADPEAPQTTTAGGKRLGTWAKYDTKGYGPVEKLSFFDPKVAKAHTTFYSQFATGMNGDEDLGEDITMKGDKFHFMQRLAQANPEAPQTTTAGGKRGENWNKYDTKGYGPVEKLSFFDPKVAKAHTSFYAQADPEAPQTTTAGGKRGENWNKYDTKGYGPVEKLSFFDPKVAKAHTSFYNKH